MADGAKYSHLGPCDRLAVAIDKLNVDRRELLGRGIFRGSNMRCEPGGNENRGTNRT